MKPAFSVVVVCLLGISSAVYGQATAPIPSLPGAPGAIFVPLPTCRILSTPTETAGNAPVQSSRHVDLRSTRCGRIVPSYAIGFALRTVSYNKAVDRVSPNAGRTERPLTSPAQANGLNFNITPNEDLAVDLTGYFVAVGTPLGPIGNSLPTSADMSIPAATPHAEAIGHPVAQYTHDGAQGEIYLDASVWAGSGVLMTAPNASSPWITAKLRSSDGSSGFAVATSANSNLLLARSDGAVQLLNGAFLDGRTDYFGSAGQNYGHVPIPTNIVHDVTLIDPQDAANGATTRVVFYNAQTDDEYMSPDVTKYRAYTFGFYNTKHINFDSQINYHRGSNQLYHFRAFSPSDGPQGKDTFWVKPGTDDSVTTGTRADMYVSGNVGVGTTTPTKKLQVAGSTSLNNDSSTTDLNNAYFLYDGGATGWGGYSYGLSLGYKNSRYRTMLFAPDGADVAIVTHASGTVPASQASFTERLTVQGSTGNVGIGTVSPVAGARLDVQGGNVNVGGSITATGSITGGTVHASYQDVAEWVPATHAMMPGTVVVLNPQQGSEVMPSNSAYDTSVAGVVSAQPGLILGEGSSAKEMIATTGRVKVRVDARTHPVKVGDLLVTSDVPGTAMRSEPIDVAGVKLHRPGTLIGKALEPLSSGTGEILVLLSLQ